MLTEVSSLQYPSELYPEKMSALDSGQNLSFSNDPRVLKWLRAAEDAVYKAFREFWVAEAYVAPETDEKSAVIYGSDYLEQDVRIQALLDELCSAREALLGEGLLAQLTTQQEKEYAAQMTAQCEALLQEVSPLVQRMDEIKAGGDLSVNQEESVYRTLESVNRLMEKCAQYSARVGRHADRALDRFVMLGFAVALTAISAIATILAAAGILSSASVICGSVGLVMVLKVLSEGLRNEKFSMQASAWSRLRSISEQAHALLQHTKSEKIVETAIVHTASDVTRLTTETTESRDTLLKENQELKEMVSEQKQTLQAMQEDMKALKLLLQNQQKTHGEPDSNQEAELKVKSLA